MNPSRWLAVACLVVLGARPVTAVPIDLLGTGHDVPASTRALDEAIAEEWRKHGLKPAGIIGDREFLRRATLDIVGRVPTAAEVRAFEQQKSPRKRSLLVDRLLKSDEFPRYWSSVFTAWLLTRTAHPGYQERLRGWLEKELARGTSYRVLAIKLLTATGTSSENGAAAFLLSFRGERLRDADRFEDGQYDFIPATGRAARFLLGVDIGCVRCHDHPFDPAWKQKHFWGMNGFLRQADFAYPGKTPAGQPPDGRLHDNPELNRNAIVVYETRKSVVLASRPTYLDGQKVDFKSPKTRREQLAGFLVSDRRFAWTCVNRIWSQFLGRSMTVNPVVDDFGEHNEVVMPEALAALSKEFVASDHDLRGLIRVICNSQAYQLGCSSNRSNESEEMEAYASRLLPKPLNAAQLFASAWVATRGSTAHTPERARLHAEWQRTLTIEVDRVAGNSCQQPVSNEPDLSTLMLLLNRTDFQVVEDEVLAPPRRQAEPEQIAEELYLATLTRRPRAEEMARIRAELAASPDHAPIVWQDVLWALLNSAEFYLSH